MVHIGRPSVVQSARPPVVHIGRPRPVHITRPLPVQYSPAGDKVVVGRKSFGLNLMSLVAHLKTICRMPIGQIVNLLHVLCGIKISCGELVEILHDVAEIGEPEYDGLLTRIRGSPVVNADETGWREDGVNGYL